MCASMRARVSMRVRVLRCVYVYVSVLLAHACVRSAVRECMFMDVYLLSGYPPEASASRKK